MTAKRVSWKKDRNIPGMLLNFDNKVQPSDEKHQLNPVFKRKVKAAEIFCTNYFREFTKNTTLHGLRYIGDTTKPWGDRLFWCIMCALSFIACAFLILNVWRKWEENPVIVSISAKPTPSWKINFPAITLCSETKSRQTIYNFTDFYYKNYSHLTEKERKYFDAISLMCLGSDLEGNLTTDRSIVDIFETVAPQMSNMMVSCSLKDVDVNCTTIFSPILTEEGFCFSFNMLEASELFRNEAIDQSYYVDDPSRRSGGWTLNEGYPDHLPLDTYPIRGTGSGTSAGIKITMSVLNNDLDYLCRGPVQGFKVSLHTPAEIPMVSREFVRVPLNHEVIVGVKPDIMRTSKDLQGYSPLKRHCYFPSERYLKYFKEYTKKNCDMECLANYTSYFCGCISFFMPRDPHVRICSTGSNQCIKNITDNLLVREIHSELDDTDSIKKESDTNNGIDRDKNQMAFKCNCLPGCTSIRYTSEISQSKYHWIKFLEALKEMDVSYEGYSMSSVTVFLKEPEFFTTVRSELSGFEDFIANCGGLLGLYLGFSILSLVEMFYFFIWRIFRKYPIKITRKIYQMIFKDNSPYNNAPVLLVAEWKSKKESGKRI